MPYQNDLSTLAQVVSPVDAAMQSGQQEGYGNIQSALSTNLAQQQLPLEVQKSQLNNALLQAQGQNEQGVAAQNQAKGLTAIQTQGSESGATQAVNLAKMSSAQMEQLSNMGQIVGQLSQYMQQVPGPARASVMAQFLDQHGVNDPGIRQVVASGDPDVLNKVSQGLFGVSQQARAIQLQKGMEGQTARDVANIEVQGRENVANTAADAKRYAADQARQVRMMQQNTDQALAQIVQRLGTPGEQPGDREKAQFLQSQSLQLRQLGAQTTQQLLGLGGNAADLSTIPTADINNIPSGNGGQQGAAPNGNALLEEARKRGLMK